MWRRLDQRRLRRESNEMRRALNYTPSRNGHGRHGIGDIGKLLARRPRRLAATVGLALVFTMGLGARHCWQVITTTPATFEAAELQLVELCETHGCSPETLAALLRDLRQSYTTDEEVQK